MIFAQARNLSFVYDGFPKLNKYEVGEDGEVYISEKFLNTSYYRFSQEKRDIPKVPLMGATTPSFPPFAIPPNCCKDNTNTQVWLIPGDSVALATTDSAAVQTFDPETLVTEGLLPFQDAVKPRHNVQLSCAHPQPDPHKKAGLINLAINALQSLHPTERI